MFRQKPLDFNNEFRDVNQIILDYLPHEDFIKTLKESKNAPVSDTWDLSIRRNITFHWHQKTKTWREEINNFIETIQKIKKIGLSWGQIKQIKLNEIELDPNPEHAYKKACRSYDDALVELLETYFPDNENMTFKSNLIDIRLVKDCIRHLYHLPNYTHKKHELIENIFTNMELTKYLFHTHPNPASLAKMIPDILALLLSKDRCPERILLARFLIRFMTSDAVLYNFTQPKQIFRCALLYAYEREIGKPLKIYSSDERVGLNDLIRNEIEQAMDWKKIKFIFDEHHRASYLPAEFIESLQEKANDIFMRNSEYQPIAKCRRECQDALLHPLFAKPSLMKRNIEKLLQALDGMLIPNVHPRKRKRI